MLIKTRRSKGAGTALQKMLEFFCIFQISQKKKVIVSAVKTNVTSERQIRRYIEVKKMRSYRIH